MASLPCTTMLGMSLSYGKHTMQNTEFTYFSRFSCFPQKKTPNLCAKFKMNYNFAEGLIAK